MAGIGDLETAVGAPQAQADDAYSRLIGEAQQTEDEDRVLQRLHATREPSNPWQTSGRLIWEGLQRNFRQLQATPDTLRAVGTEALGGDPLEALLASARAEEIESQAPRAQWSLQDITNPEEFAYWLSERFGENALTLLTSFAGGAAGAGIGALGARALGGSLAMRRASTLAGTVAGGFATSAPIETAATGQEQFQVTGSTQPELAIPAGVLKGLLELWTPTKVIRALGTPGRQLGATIPGAVVSTAGREAATEGLQESIDIALRMHSDPDYRFFGEGPYPSLGEGGWRLLESMAAGGAIGGLVGTGSAIVENRQERKRDQGPLAPGQTELVRKGGTAQPPAPDQSFMLRPQPEGFVEVYRGDFGKGFETPNVDMAMANEPGLFFTTDLTEAEAYAKGVGHPDFDAPTGPGGFKTGSSLHRTTLDTRNFKEVKWTGDPAYQDAGLRYQVQKAQEEGYSGAWVTLPTRKGGEPRTQYVVWDQNAVIEPGVQLASVRVPSRRGPSTVEGMVAVPETGRRVRITVDDANYAGNRQGQILDEEGNVVGDFYVRQLRGSKGTPSAFQVGRITIDDEYQRQGIYGALSQHLESIIKLPHVPDSTLSDDAYNWWLKKDKILVEGRYTRAGDDVWLLHPMEDNIPFDSNRMWVVRDRATRPENLGPLSSPLTEDGFYTLPGPVTELRNMIMRNRTQDVDLLQATIPLPREDLLQATPMLRTLPGDVMELYLDVLEANTERFIIEREGGRFEKEMLNSNDAIFVTATELNQDVRPNVRQVKQDSLVPAMITAELFDLPPATSRRVWFLPSTPQEKQAELLEQYSKMSVGIEQNRWDAYQDVDARIQIKDALMPFYEALLSEGLRVIPSRGASFYYGAAPFESEVREQAITLKTTTHVAFMHPDGRILTRYGEDMGYLENQVNASATVITGGIPVSLDFDKFQPGEISALPMMFGGVVSSRGIKGTTPENEARVLREMQDIVPEIGTPWKGPDILTFRERYLKKGIYFDPRMAAVSELLTKETITPDKVVPGINNWPYSMARPEQTIAHYAHHKSVRPGPSTLEGSSPAIGQFLEGRVFPRLIREVLPAVDTILRNIGIDGGVSFRVQTTAEMTAMHPQLSHHTMAYADANTSSITFVVGNGVWPWNETALKEEFATTLSHELGHVVTLHYYSKLPTEIQQQLVYAYNRALMTKRANLSLGMGRFNYLRPQIDFGETYTYFTSFAEWLAEQFRRFTTEDEVMLGEVENALGGISEYLNRLYTQLTNKLGGFITRDLFASDYYFSAFMQYLRDYGREKVAIRQRERQQALYAIGEDVYESPAATRIVEQVITALESMAPMFPAEHPFHVMFGVKPDQRIAAVDENIVARTVHDKLSNKILLEMAIGALPATDTPQAAREVFAHELLHVYVKLNLITRAEMNVLYSAAVKEGKQLSLSMKTQYRAHVTKLAKELGWTPEVEEAYWQQLLREETIAYYIGEYARTGTAGPEARTLLDRILAVLKRVMEFMFGINYATRDSVLEAFFRGEMVSRASRKRQEEERVQSFMRMFAQREMDMMPDEIRPTNDPNIVAEIERIKDEEGNLEYANYQFRDTTTNEVIGLYQLEVDPVRGFNIAMSYWVTPGMHRRWQKWIENDMGLKLLAPPTFTIAGMEVAKRMYPGIELSYAFDGELGEYYSAKFVRKQKKLFERIQKQANREGSVVGLDERKNIAAEVRYWRKMERKLPKQIWNMPEVLDQMFALQKNTFMDGVQGTIVREGVEADEASLERIVGQSPAPGSDLDNYRKMNAESLHLSQWTAAQKLGLEYADQAPESPETMHMKRILSWADRRGATTDPRYEPYLKRVPQRVIDSQEADRIGFFTRVWWGIQQLAWRNEHLAGLQIYKQYVELYHASITGWHRDADDVARRWETELREPRQRAQFNEMLFWLVNMDYRTPAEVGAKVERHPTQAELTAEITRRGLDAKAVAFLPELYQHPMAAVAGAKKDIFGRFLDAVEAISTANLNRTLATNPVALAAALTELQKEMNQLRSKPYFPISRFGQHSITTRDPVANDKVTGFWTFDSHTERDAAIEQIARDPEFALDDLHVGRVPEEYFEFMGLPAPLIRDIRINMPGITPAQAAWLEAFELQNLPDKSFRKRWIPRGGVAGHSMDGFRSFAHYFMHGSRYLARLQYRQELLNAVSSVEDSKKVIPNSSKRQMIIDYMKAHYNYLMEGGKDWAKFKAAISLLQLGFSPAAAAMNLTQLPMVTRPWLTGIFGRVDSFGQLTKSLRAARNLRKGYVTSGVGNYDVAREEMIRQGRIDIGQAAELGAFAEGNNLLGLLAGTKRQKLYRDFTWYGMWMFQRAEQVNREVTMHSVWELAHKQMANNKRLAEIKSHYFFEIMDLQQRLSTPTKPFSADDAAAFILAKEALDQTQGLYAPYARPTFMRTPLAGTLLIFYQFVHTMTYAFRYNPGLVQMWLMMAFVYGVSGVPGAEDINELLRLLAKRLFGKDFDLEHQARKMVREISRGTIFDEVGPDLFLHGISRYGFGLGLLPDGYGIGKFDASANGSLGKLIPGLYEGLHAANTAGDSQQFVSDTTQRLAGAGFGWFFNFAQFAMTGPGTVDGHRWEQALPRTLRSMAAAYRYAPIEWGLPEVGPLKSVGGATLPSGARIASFSATDPEDVAAIVTQMLGFGPTKVREAQELRRTQLEAERIFMARRGALFVQFTSATLARRPDVVQDVLKAITEYNDEVRREDRPELGITGTQLRASTRSREQNRLLQEQFVAPRRLMRPEYDRIKDLFPGVQPQVVK